MDRTPMLFVRLGPWLEDMLTDLIAWQDPAWTSHVDELAGNAAGLFAALK